MMTESKKLPHIVPDETSDNNETKPMAEATPSVTEEQLDAEFGF